MSYDTVLTALADNTRRSIFEHVARRPLAVGELAAKLPISQPAVSQHLRVLREAGLVEVDTEGTRHIHRVNPAGLRSLRDYLDNFWDDVLDSFQQAAKVKAERLPNNRKPGRKSKGGSER